MDSNKGLVDSHGRRVNKLRFSLNDACNMRCMYCMPEGQTFCAPKELLSSEEIYSISKNLTKFGLEEIRLTGGEPLLRQDFIEIANRLSTLNLKKLGVTTNGILLEKKLSELNETNLKHLNISLDSLNPANFKRITKLDALNKVLSAVHKAQDLGFKVKINTVALKGINSQEILDFVDYSAKHDLEIRFLELMKIGVANQYHQERFISAKEIISIISSRWKMNKIKSPHDSTSFNYEVKLAGRKARIGFIASESQPFCNSCSRIRITSKGELRPCIMVDAGPGLKGLAFEEYSKLLGKVIEQKPVSRLESYELAMNEIGG